MRFRGASALKKHRCGKKISPIEAIEAKCYDCLGGYADGAFDCQQPDCTLYPFMPYRGCINKNYPSQDEWCLAEESLAIKPRKWSHQKDSGHEVVAA